jgi:periplasmic protein TonB
MTAMTLHSPYLAAATVDRSGMWRNGLAASLAVGLHVIVLALLVRGWVLESPAVLRTQLVILAPTPEAPAPLAPVPEPLPAVVQPSPEPLPATPAPIKPAVDPQVQAQKLQQAALARKRVEEKKRDLQAEQQRERLEAQNRAREAEQQRLAQQQLQQAEQVRLSAERARQQAAQAAADSRQYLPLSKEAPDYPQRALDKNLEGDCTVEYTVNPQGKVEHPKVLDGCHPLFMRPSLAAADTFRYQPRMIDGRAVSVPAVRNTFHYRIK